MSSKQKIFQIVNTVLVIAILGFYIGRLFYYKADFDRRYNEEVDVSSNYLYEIVEKGAELMTENGLVENADGSFSFIGKADNNYIIYSNRLFRILDINADGNIRMISQDPVTLSVMDGADFEHSDLYNWLNPSNIHNVHGVFAAMLQDTGVMLINGQYCDDVIDDVNNITSNHFKNDVLISLPTLQDYSNCGAAESYLNNGTEFWLGNVSSDSEHRYWYVDQNGQVSKTSSKTELKGVRVVLTLSYSATAISGNGTSAQPYVLSDKKVKTASELTSGQYVQFAGQKWIVNNVDENGNAVLMMQGCLKDRDGNDLLMSFGSKNIFDDKQKNSVAMYLNTTFLNSISNYQRYLVANRWNYGVFTEGSNYCWENSYQQSYNCYVSIPNTSFIDLDQQSDIYLNTIASTTDKLIFTISDDFQVFADLLENQHHIRPVICLNGQIRIVTGNGALNNPYELEAFE